MSDSTLSAADIRSMVERRSSFAPDEVTAEALREAGCLDRVFALPKAMDERTSYFANVLVQMFGIGSHVKDERLKATASHLCQALCYLSNSTSWRDGELHDFDELELSRKLRPLVRK